jgi:hypothetical protein
MVPPAFVVVSMIVSTLPVVLVVCSTTLVISLLTVVLLALISPSSKLRDNNGASAATGGGNDSKDNMVELPYSTISLLPTVIAMSPPDRIWHCSCWLGAQQQWWVGLVLLCYLRLH